MPRKLEIDALEAEAAGLRALLSEATQYGDPVGELQYKERLDEIDRELEHLRTTPSALASVALYFGGAPVIGSRGIAADFAGRALAEFQDLVSKTYAKLELGGLGQRGRVPFRQNTDLMVTGLTHGSFGFVLDELADQHELHDTALKEVVGVVSNLLIGAGANSESEFELIAEDLDPRTLIALREFFKDMDSAGATVRVVGDESEFLLDEAAISRGRLRTEATQIDEEMIPYEGVLIGFLPDHRRFELRDPNGVTIYGTATKTATEQFEAAIGQGGSVIGANCRAKLLVRTVRPLQRPPRLAYRLMEFYRIGDALWGS